MSELEDAAVAIFRAIRSAGAQHLGHDQFGFRVDVGTMCPPEDKEAALKLGAEIQAALDYASKVTQPIIVQGTTLQ